jgi:hydrogenase maturation protein HypF
MMSSRPDISPAKSPRCFATKAVGAAFAASVPVVAAGADQMPSFAIMRDSEVLLGGPLGDPGDPGVGNAWREDLEGLLELYEIGSAVIAADLHPGYRSRALAEELAAEHGWPVYLVQHHFAHLCAVLLEYGMHPGEEALGLILDGTGYGTDGTVWGCEILEGSLIGFRRRGHLKTVTMPGGDAAVREPRRMAAAHLAAAGLRHDWPELDQVMRSRSLSPMTSSAGRLFDAAAYILGVSPARVASQAEAARLFESAADPGETGFFDMVVDGDCVIDPSGAIRGLLDDSIPVSARAAMFHNGFARALCDAALKALGSRHLPIVLAGGCWANALLLRAVSGMLSERRLDVLCSRSLPVGDGAVSAGQAAAVAAALIRSGGRPAPGRVVTGS